MCPNHHDKYISDDDSMLGSKCKVTLSSDVGTFDSTEKSIHWNEEQFDIPGGMFDGLDEHIIIKKAGYYIVIAAITWASSAVGTRRLFIYVNDVKVAHNYNSTPIAYAPTQLVYYAKFEIDDEIDVRVWQDSGGNLNVRDSADKTFFTVYETL